MVPGRVVHDPRVGAAYIDGNHDAHLDRKSARRRQPLRPAIGLVALVWRVR